VQCIPISATVYHANRSLSQATRGAVDATSTPVQSVGVDHGRADIVVAQELLERVVWNVCFGPLKLGRLLETHMHTEGAFGRLKRHL
jgi:hypothetical protein